MAQKPRWIWHENEPKSAGNGTISALTKWLKGSEISSQGPADFLGTAATIARGGIVDKRIEGGA
jgi:hypothetical protein